MRNDASRRDKVIAIGLAMLMPLGWISGHNRLADFGSNVPAVRLRIVQPNIPQDEKWRSENASAIFDKLVSLTVKPSADYPNGTADITHVIWPESAVPFLLDESEAAKVELRRALKGKTVLITGAVRRDSQRTDSVVPPPLYNSVLVFDGQSRVIASYDKWRLVPGGEFLPFESLLEPLGFRKVVTLPGSFAAGPGALTLAIAGAPAASFLVCYEAIFPHGLVDARARPQWLVNVTNDGWFGKSTGPHQHLAQARLRTIEQGLPIVRAANTGISAVIDAKGRIITSLPVGSEGVIDSMLPADGGATLYSRAVDMPLLLLIILSLAGALLTMPDRGRLMRRLRISFAQRRHVD